MTQPPPPPSDEPPQGGFGAPYDPRPGGFGDPPPPPRSGYGYPGPNSGYGYPGPNSGYGYPGPQPGYGYPPQLAQQSAQPQPQPQSTQPPSQPQPYQQPPQDGGGLRKLSAQPRIIIAAAAAVVLIIGAGVWFASSGDDGTKNDAKRGSAGRAGGATRSGTSSGTDGGASGGTGGGRVLGGGGKEMAPHNVKSRRAFTLPAPQLAELTGFQGSWLTGATYVKTGVDEIVGYHPDTGAQLWTIPLPGQVCAASRQVTDTNETAIAFEAVKRTPKDTYAPCTEIGVIDLDAGKLLWSRSVPVSRTGDEKAAFDEVTLSGRTVAAGGLYGGAAFDVTDGTIRWQPEAHADQCADRGYGGGQALVAVRRCGLSDDMTLVIRTLNPLTGEPVSSYTMPSGVRYASIVSTAPLVVAADSGGTAKDGSGISEFFSLDGTTGKLRARIPADPDRYAARCEAARVESCGQVVVGNDRIYLPTEDHDRGEDYGDTNEIVSFDLATGRATPDRADAAALRSLFPLRMDGGNLLAYQEPSFERGGQVVSIDGGTFEQTVLMRNPDDATVRDAEDSYYPNSTEYLYGNGRLFLSRNSLSKSGTSSLDGKSGLALAFSTG
ncbi:hypothetical protein [Streptomyces sp. NPDC051569]|uniref:hypothetical protein n=1 Tax=Streptomyces sp. NPDC051569 TaxID=3365661 RepID=UPI0037ABC6A8